jgi:uncharacterized repeat protein (TIGR01451 family)
MKVLAALAGAALLALAPFAAAQQKAAQPLETKIEQRKVVRAADGAESLVAAEAVKPGDVIEYTVTYRNTGKAGLSKLEATLPIPSETELVAGSARPANAKASTDSRTFADMPLKRTVKRNGVDVTEDVPLREYRALRWYPGDLAGEKSLSYTARVRVLDARATN